MSQTTSIYYTEHDRASISDDISESFIKNITHNDIREILFSDHLACYSNSGSVVGSYECSIDLEYRDGRQIIHVIATNKGSAGGMTCETSIDAFVTQQMVTLFQTQTETITGDKYLLKRITSIEKTNAGYKLKRETMENDNKSSSEITYTTSSLQTFISEAANLILQRLLVKKGFSIPFETSGLDMDGIPSATSYGDLGERHLIIDSSEVTVYGIERTLHAQKNIPTAWQSYYLSDGHLVLRIQVGSPIIIKAKAVPQLFAQEEYLSEPSVITSPFEWKDDVELYSKYLDRKEEIKASYLLYLRNNPVVKEMLSDFLQALLMQKPENTIEFAVEFFKKHSVRSLPTRAFLDSRI